MSVRSRTFVRWCVEEHLGTQQAPALEAALRHHADALGSGRHPLELPAGLVDEASAEPAWENVRISAGRGTLRSLEREAALRSLTVDRMLTHAFFVYLSALDSGELD